MRLGEGLVEEGPAGTAVELVFPPVEERDPPATAATVAGWFVRAPGQSPAWECYVVSVVHLRPIEGAPPAVVTVPRSTHELLVVALDPRLDPRPVDTGSWSFLRPVNVCEQAELPDDDAAVELCRLAARAIVAGVLPAEPMLAGAVEPWRTSIVRTSAHLRGEEHAP